jgi:hydroxymethylpyrimidine pyrophosphatase-like HAD family hydrolase
VIELVVTDLDGSLWVREAIHPATMTAWTELEARGIPVIVATGRRLTTTRAPLARAGLTPSAVVLNGALALDLATDERFHRHHYDPDVAARVLHAFRTAALDPCVYVEHTEIEIYVGARPSTHPGHLASFGTGAVIADLDEIVATEPVLGFGVIGHAREPLRAVVGAIGDAAETHLSGDSQWGGDTLTVAPPGLSKWAGVLAYCERAGIDPDRVLAIGDGPNDVELLTNAAVAVVPDDAFPEAIALADHLVAPPDQGGWATVLDLV